MLVCNTSYTQSNNPAPYCNPFDDCDFEDIERFEFANVNNTNSCVNQSGVTYYNNTTINVTKGKSYTFNVEVEPDNFVTIWIDFDKNGTFEADEAVVQRSSDGDFTTSYQIPTNAACGETRLRVISAEDSQVPATSACNNPGDNGGDGENQDYNIDIQPQNQVPNDINVLSVDASPNPSDSAFGDLNVLINNAGTQPLSAGDTIPFEYETSLQSSPKTVNHVLQSPLGSCASTSISFEKVFSNSCQGANFITVFNQWNPDGNPSNDTARTRVLGENPGPMIAFEGLESGLPSNWSVVNDASANIQNNSCVYKGSNSLLLAADEPDGTLLSPDFNLSNKTFGVTVSFYFREARPSCGPNGDDPEDDDGYVFQYSTDGGINWTTIQNTQGSNYPTNFTKFQERIQVGSSNNIRFRIVVEESEGSSNDNWVFDDFEITAISEVESQNPPQSNIVPQKAFVNAPQVFTVGGASNAGGPAWSVNGSKVGSSNQITYTFQDTGTQNVGVDLVGCFFETVKGQVDVVEPTQKPNASFFAGTNTLCTDEAIEIANETGNGATDFQWKVTPQKVNGKQAYRYLNSDSAFRPRIEFLEAADYNVKLIASNKVGSDTFTRSQYLKATECYETCNDMMATDSEGLLFDSAGRDAFVDEENPASCSFTINPACSDQVVANLRQLNIAGTLANGSRDNLKVYDGTSTSAPAIHDRLGYSDGFYEGNAPSSSQDLIARSGAMTVVLSTNGEDGNEDFILEWEAQQSASVSLQQAVRTVTLDAPDTAYTTGSSPFQVKNPVKDATYELILPGFNRAVSQDTIIPATVSGIDQGAYPVKLVTQRCGFADTIQEMVYFQDVANQPTAEFTASSTQFVEGDTVKLFDLSQPGIEGHEWSFEPSGPVSFVNGTDSASINPSIVIDQAGDYRVDLIVENGLGRSVEAKVDYLTVERPTSTIESGCTPAVGNQVEDLSINQFSVYNSNGDLLYTNSSGYSSNGYGQFDAGSDLSLASGREYIFEIERNTAFNDFSYAAWLDVNGDGDLASDEALFTNTRDSGFLVRDTVAIPGGKPGIKTLRIATNQANGSLNGCGPHQTGEFEDYSVNFRGDIDAPTITLKGGSAVTLDVCNPSAADTGATAIDAVDGNISGQVELRNADLLNSPGTYQLPYVVIDSAGNRATKTQTITVTPDNTDPQVSLNGQSNIVIDLNERFMDPGVTTSDACGKVDTVLKNGTVNTSVIGKTTVTYIAVDGAGNTDTVNRTVVVNDPIAPTARLNGRDTITLPVFENYEELGIVSNDNYRDSTIVRVQGSVNTDSVGVYDLTYEVVDLDTNVTTLNRTVIVEDNEAPTFSDIPDNAVILPVNNPIDVPFTVTDNYYGEEDLQVTRDGGYANAFPSGIADSLGTYTARFQITDGSGNSNAFTIAVEVVDRQAPMVTLNRPVVNINRFGRFQDSLGSTYTVNDNYYDSSEITINRSGSYFTDYVQGGQAPGIYEIRYRAVDASGNESDPVVRTVNVRNKTTGIDDQGKDVGIEVYPNPTGGPVNIELSNIQQNPVNVSVINANGQTVRKLDHRITSANDTYNLDLSSEAKGLYKVKVRAGDEVVTESVVVQ